MILPCQLPLWLETAFLLALGTCLVVAWATVGVRLTASAVWQRAFWRVSILGLLLLLVAEGTGLSAGIGQWWQINEFLPRSLLPSFAESAESSSEPTDLPVTSVVPDDPSPSMSLETGAIAGRVESSEPIAEWGVASGSEPEPLASCFGPHDDDEGDSSLPDKPISGAAKARDTASMTPASRGGPGHSSWGEGLVVIWGLGTVLLLVRIAQARWRLRRFRLGQPCHDQAAIRQRVEQLAGRLGMARRVDLLVSPWLTAPIAFGSLRPVIVLPAHFAEDFDARQQDAMLAHELAHLAARDPVWQLLADLVVALLWWHPLVWWARRRWHVATEWAADEACLLVPQGADTLAGCLVVLARRLETCPRLAWLAMAGPGFRSALGQRIERLLRLPAYTWAPPGRKRLGVVTATVPVALLVVVISCTAWVRTRVPEAEGATSMTVFMHCWRQSLTAVTLAALLSPWSGDTSQTLAADEGNPPAKVERKEGDRKDVKPKREGEDRDRKEVTPKPEGERRDRKEVTPKPEGERREGRQDREGRKPEARGERERDRERGGEREARAQEMAKRRAQLQAEAQKIRRKLETVKPDQEAQARELRGALERIEAQLRELRQPAANREGIRARLEELKNAQRQAQEAGRADEADRLAREVRELMRVLEERPGDRPARRPEGDEVQRRMQHLRMAIENLRAAGLHAQAEALARDAERLLQGERPPSPEGRRPEGPRDIPPGPPQLERAVRELNGQVQEMRQQMEEIRRQLKSLAEKR